MATLVNCTCKSFIALTPGLEIILIKFYLPLAGKIVDRLARFA